MSRAGTGDSGNRPGSPIPIESRRIRSITFLLALLALACGAKPPEPMDKIRQHILAARTSHRDLLAGLKIDFTRTQGWSQASQHEYESRLEIRATEPSPTYRAVPIPTAWRRGAFVAPHPKPNCAPS